MISRAYVFIDGIEDTPVICGVVELDTQANLGRFRYGQSYLQRPDAFPLDPIHLPLLNSQFVTRVNRGMFGVILDAGADSWGRRILYSLHATQPSNDLELVVAGAGMGVGALTFSLSRSATKPKKSKNTLGDIPLLLTGKNTILKDENTAKEVKKAFEYGSSMGGARPKTLIEDKTDSYIAKFNRVDDLYNVCLVEHATMRMLSELKTLHMRVADTRVVASQDENILLVKRFDQHKQQASHHFLSANALINQHTITHQALTTSYSYGALAEFIMKYVAEPRDAHELYARMIFNILMGNTDDHARNHAFLYSFTDKCWRLSPAYDVLPINNARQQAIGVGDQGRTGSIENALSQCKRFGLSQPKAKKIVATVQDLTAEWQSYFAHCGVSEGDIRILKRVIAA